ncbi:MAG TPA: helix-turn-helix domain-containing protein [Kofleriaceae bacterium]|nr:helix-turn-helix domain-containing protein [Kofleriaceae bacterium]
MSLALWLRAGRTHKGMSLESVAKVTKIQPRILERLEAGKLDGLPADVFVRGFVRSVAKCVGLDESEALKRYMAATGAGAPSETSATVAARAFVETMSELAPAASTRAGQERIEAARLDQLQLETERTQTAVAEATRIDVVRAHADHVEAERLEAAAPVVAAVEAVAVTTTSSSSGGKKKRGKRGGKQRKRMATGTPSAALPVVTPVTLAPGGEAPEPLVGGAEGSRSIAEVAPSVVEVAPSDAEGTVEAQGDDLVMAQPWTPKMPTVVAPTVPWRRPHTALAASRVKVPVVPSLVIDDADPDSADREREDRVERHHTGRRSFLPPILLDREDRTARQGGLTLAVIILLIAATLTLSYLMRRPSSTGDGVTLDESGQRDILT